jgi:hypothetical protein
MDKWGPLGQKGDMIHHWRSSKILRSRNCRKAINRQNVIILDGFYKSGREAEVLTKKWFDFCIPQWQTRPGRRFLQKPANSGLPAVRLAAKQSCKECQR